MSTVNDLPAHVLLVHFVIVLIPVTVVLEIALPASRGGHGQGGEAPARGHPRAPGGR